MTKALLIYFKESLMATILSISFCNSFTLSIKRQSFLKDAAIFAKFRAVSTFPSYNCDCA